MYHIPLKAFHAQLLPRTPWHITSFFWLIFFSCSRAMELKLKGIIGSKESWESIDDMANIYWTNRTPMSGISLQIKLLIFISSMLQRNVVIWCPPVNSTLNRSFWFMLTHETEVVNNYGCRSRFVV